MEPEVLMLIIIVVLFLIWLPEIKKWVRGSRCEEE